MRLVMAAYKNIYLIYLNALPARKEFEMDVTLVRINSASEISSRLEIITVSS